MGVRALIGTAVVTAVMGLGYHASSIQQQQQTITALQQAKNQQAGSWNVVFVALNAVSYLSISSDQADAGHLDRFSMNDASVLPPLQSLTSNLQASDILMQYQKNHVNGDPAGKINGIGFIKTVYHLAGQDLPAAVTSGSDYWASFQKDATWMTAPNDGSAAPLPGDIIMWQNDTSDIAIVVEVNTDSVIVAQADTIPNVTTPDSSAPVIQAYNLHLVQLPMQNNKVSSLNNHAITGFVRNPSLFTDPYTATSSALVSAIIAYAQKKLDFPYLYGGNCAPGGTPNSHTNGQLCDCSGLVVAAYKYGAHLDLSSTRTSMEQVTTGPQNTIGASIPFDKLQPGDLIFPIDSWDEVQNGVKVNGFGHVGIYIGYVATDGKHTGTGDHTIIEAPHTGDVVKYDQMTNGYWGKQGSVFVQPTVLAQALAKEAANLGGGTCASTGSTMSASQVKSCIISVFGPLSSEALSIANCESSFDATNRSKIPVKVPGKPDQYAEGVFQFIETTWDETPEGKVNSVIPGTLDVSTDPRYNAEANIRAALWLHNRDGNWREWQCAQIVGLT